MTQQTPPAHQLMIALQQAFAPRQLLSSLIAGLVAGIIAVTVSAAFAALIFPGELAGYLPLGIGSMLFGSIVIGGLTALLSSFPGLVAGLQDSAVAILALVSAAIVQSMPGVATQHQTFLTVAAAVVLSSLLTGAVLLLLGVFKQGNLIRFIPYPVVGGFLAGSGLLLVLGALSVMTDTPISLRSLSPLLQVELWARWLPGLILGVFLLIVVRRYNHFLIVPGMLLAGVAAFYAVLWLTQTSVAEAGAQGWLLNAFPEEGGELWQPFSLADLGQVHWPVLARQAGGLLAVVVVQSPGYFGGDWAGIGVGNYLVRRQLQPHRRGAACALGGDLAQQRRSPAAVWAAAASKGALALYSRIAGLYLFWHGQLVARSGSPTS
jgi:SulP family sulfate permease